MNRKLPPDSEVAALHLSGLTYREIGQRYDVSPTQVQHAMDRWREKPITHKSMIKATVSKEFVRAGVQPVEHRDTGEGGQALHIGLDGVYQRRSLQLHECRDLLREWGVA